MKRLLAVGFGFGIVGGAMAGLTGAAYWLNHLIVENVASGQPGLLHSTMEFLNDARVVNILIFMLTFVMVLATLLTIAERKWSALMQDRVGPNRAKIGGFAMVGIPHTIADAVKMIFKEDFRPQAAKASRVLFQLAPVLAFAPIFVLFAVVPPAPDIKWAGHAVSLTVSSPDFGILYLFAIASLAVYGTSLAGWASNNKFALLGGVRASSQMISYEVALGLSLVGIMMTFGSVQLMPLIEGQTSYLWKGEVNVFNAFTLDVGLPAWGIFLQPVGFLLFFAAAFAETKRAPFDVPEGESEIIGYFLEYSGMKFGLFMISEFVEVVVLSSIITALFLGGFHLPFGGEALMHSQFMQENAWVWGTLLGVVFWTKVVLLCWVQLLIRWTFPRFRYDQIQTLGWKMLLPMGLVNVFVTGALILWGQEQAPLPTGLFQEAPALRLLGIVGLLELGLVAALTASTRSEASSSPSHPAAPAHPAAAHSTH